MHVENSTPPTTRDIRLDIISMNEWRVRDRRFPERDARCVLGFIERDQFTYQAMHVLPSGSVASYGSLATATASFSVD